MSIFDSLIVRTLPIVPKPIVGRFSRRYIAGPGLDDAMRVVRDLNAQGAMGTVDVLGESIENLGQAKRTAGQYVAALEAIDRLKLDSNISVKLSALGLMLDRGFCLEAMHTILERARAFGSFVRIDMEDSSYTTDTIGMYEELRRTHANVGVVIQAYLRRSHADVKRLASEGANFRLCKGIYVEPRAIAYKDPAIVSSNYTLLLETILAKGCYVGIATHDERLVWEAIRLTEARGLGRDRFEFQMLLGVDEELRRILIKAGYRLRVYVPFGEEWYAYSVRRLKENPKLAGQVFRNVLRGAFVGPSKAPS